MKIIAAASVSFAAILWGFDGIVLTPRLYNLDVLFVVFVLHLLPFAIMHIFLFREYKQIKRFTGEDLGFFILIAVFGGFAGTAAIVKALFLVNFQELSVVVLLQKLQPVFSIALAAIILKETLKARFVIWAIIALTASYFLVFGVAIPDLSTGNQTGKAALYALLAAFSFGSSTVFSKKILRKYPFKTATFFRYGFTTFILFIIILLTRKLNMFHEISTTNWMYFLIIAFTTGSGAIFLYYYGLVRIRAMLATICELFFPLSAILFDYLFNEKVLSPIQWIAAGVMIFSIIKLTWQAPAKPKSDKT